MLVVHDSCKQKLYHLNWPNFKARGLKGEFMTILGVQHFRLNQLSRQQKILDTL